MEYDDIDIPLPNAPGSYDEMVKPIIKVRNLDLDETRILVNTQVNEELLKAIEKHGIQKDIGLDKQFVIFAEEFGEVAMALLKEDYENAREEINQTIAMAIKLRWLIDLKLHKERSGK